MEQLFDYLYEVSYSQLDTNSYKLVINLLHPKNCAYSVGVYTCTMHYTMMLYYFKYYLGVLVDRFEVHTGFQNSLAYKRSTGVNRIKV